MTHLIRSIGSVSTRRSHADVATRMKGIATAWYPSAPTPTVLPDRRPSRRGLPLRGYLAAIMVLAVAVAGSGALYGRDLSEREARQAATANAEHDARLGAEEIGDALTALEANVARTATTPGLEAVFVNATGCSLSYAPTGPFAEGRIDIVHPDGSIACSSDPSSVAGRGYAGADWLEPALAAPTFVGSAVDPTTGDPGVVHTAPIAGKGIMVGFLDLASVGPMLAEHLDGDVARLEILLLDRAGTTVLARSVDPTKWVREPLPRGSFGGQGGSGADIDGRARLYGEATVPGPGWHLYVGADTAEVLGHAELVFRRQLMIILIGLLILLGAMVVLDRRVTLPIRRLSEAMGGDRDGPAAHPVDISGPAEIVSLARDFNRMLAVLDDELVTRGRLAAIIESAEDAIISTTLDGTVTSWNGGAERLYGYNAEEMIGREFTPIVPGNDPIDLGSLLADVRDGSSIQPYEARRVRKDGTVVHVSIALSPVRGHDGRIEGVSASARDISEQKAAERDLLRSNAELEQFAYVASHDLSEPLRTISGYTELLGRRYEGQIDDDADRFIRHTIEGCARMRRLIDDLLSYSRSGRSVGAAVHVDTAQTVRSVCAAMRSVLDDGGVVIEVGDLPVVKGDPVQLAQLFQNLVANSVKFAQPGTEPRIRIDARRLGTDWEFSVADNGIGIEPEYRERVFKMFQRLHGRDAYDGTGIGLAICLRIVQAHGGSIWIDSGDDGGTVCRFTLPFMGEVQSA
jgi:PAS domain S-box-containing protein